MKKQKRNSTRKKNRNRQPGNKNVVRLPVRKRKTGELGIFDRDYPPSFERKSTVERIRLIPDSERTPDDWWMLGEFLVYDGLLDEDDTLVNDGIQSLTSGSNHLNPSPACMLDLAWVLMHRGIDGMALPYLEKAVKLAPQSRDAWSLKAVCHIGNSQRDQAITSIKQAISISSAAESDHSLLSDLESTKDLKEIRRLMVLRKMEPELLGTGRYSSKEEAKVICHILAPLLENDPENKDILNAVGYARYILGHFEKARQILNRLIEIAGNHAEAHTLLGLIARKNKSDAEEERRQYELALNDDPNYLLALVNLSYLMQEDGEYHEARSFLLRALEGNQKDPNYAIALDLYGSNVGVIDNDFEQEASLHEKASKLDPSRPNFKANLVIALLSGGKAKEARAVFQKDKSALRAVPQFDFLNGLVEAYTRNLEHPYEYMLLIDKCNALLGWKAMGILVKKAWAIKGRVEHEELLDFYESIATFAHHAGLPELSLEAWQEGSEIEGARGFKLNAAVELNSLGRHAEALGIVENEPKDLPRSWTVLGNIRMDNGLFGAAIEAYRNAIEKDEKFLLPYSSAIDCAFYLKAPWELTQFIEKLQSDWVGNTGAQLLLAQTLFAQGKARQASELFWEHLVEGDAFLSPDEVFDKTSDPEDLSVFSNPSTEHHYLAAQAFIRSGNYDACGAMLAAITHWPKWQNGDWSVIQAELLRLNEQYEDALEALEHMRDQPPPHITRALCSLDQEDFDGALASANLALNVPNTDGYNHPVGRPDAVALAILAACANHDTNFESAEKYAKEAIVRDAGCALSRIAMGQALRQLGREDEAAKVLEEAIKRTPGDPAIISLLIDVLISLGNVEQAESILGNQKDLLIQNNAEVLRHKLGELIAIAKLNTDGAETNSSVLVDWPWIHDLDKIYQKWLSAAHTSLQRSEELQSATILYVGKVAEKAVVEKVMKPFLNGLNAPERLVSDHYKDVSRFFEGGRPPSIGGFVRLLKAAERPFRSVEEGIVTEFRNFLKETERKSKIRLRDTKLIRGLETLARLRNDAAHTEDPKSSDVDLIMALISQGEDAGILLTSLGLLGTGAEKLNS